MTLHRPPMPNETGLATQATVAAGQSIVLDIDNQKVV
jgi:hypothetical protein